MARASSIFDHFVKHMEGEWRKTVIKEIFISCVHISDLIFRWRKKGRIKFIWDIICHVSVLKWQWYAKSFKIFVINYFFVIALHILLSPSSRLSRKDSTVKSSRLAIRLGLRLGNVTLRLPACFAICPKSSRIVVGSYSVRCALETEMKKIHARTQ